MREEEEKSGLLNIEDGMLHRIDLHILAELKFFAQLGSELLPVP